MLRLTVIQVGKEKDRALQSLCDEYLKRLQAMFDVTVVTTKDEEQLWAKIPKSSFVIALEVEGKIFDSPTFAKFIHDKQVQGISHITVLIGPAAGFGPYPRGVDLKLSLSAMTFSHQTIRLLLLEQLYRAGCILTGKPFPR